MGIITTSKSIALAAASTSSLAPPPIKYNNTKKAKKFWFMRFRTPERLSFRTSGLFKKSGVRNGLLCPMSAKKVGTKRDSPKIATYALSSHEIKKSKKNP